MDVAGYELEAVLGEGPVGVVHRARAKATRKTVALKLLPAKEESPAEERRVLDAITRGGGFVPIIDAGSGPEGSWVVMPLIGGGTLRQRLEARAFSIEEALGLLKAVAAAVASAHARGVAHGDLKPENILFERGRPLVADLGLAKRFGIKRTIPFFRHGFIRGTVGYAAPEQMADGAEPTLGADVFALGAILYECLAELPAFSGEGEADVGAKIVAGEFEPLATVRPDMPAKIAVVVERALTVDPAKRYGSASELLRALEGVRLPKKPIFGRVVAVTFLTLVLGGAATALGLEHARAKEARAACLAERAWIEQALAEGQATVTRSIAASERAVALGNERLAHVSADEAVKAGESMVMALDRSRLELNREWIAKFRDQHGPDARGAQAAALVARARAFFATDDPAGVEKGNRDLDQASGLDESSPELICAQAEQAVCAQKINDALERLREASGYAKARLLEARIHLMIRSEPSEALRSVEAALDLASDDETRARALSLKALAFEAKEAAEPPTKSLVFADEAVKLAPALWETHTARARLLVALGRRREARTELKTAMERGKGEVAALIEAARVYLSMRCYDEARMVIDVVLASRQPSLEAYVLRAEIKEALLDIADARADAEQVNSHAQNVKKYWAEGAGARRLLSRGWCLVGSPDDVKQAGQQSANAAKEFDPEGVPTKLRFAKVMLDRAWGTPNGNLESVDRLLREASKRQGTDPEVKLLLLRASFVRNFPVAPHKVRELAAKTVAACPLAPYSHAVLAAVMPQDSDEGDREALRALELERDVRRDEGYYYALGLRGILELAPQRTAALRRAIFEDPLHAQAFYALGGVSESLGRDARHIGDAETSYMWAKYANSRFAAPLESFARAIRLAVGANSSLLEHAEEYTEKAEALRGGSTAATLEARAWRLAHAVGASMPDALVPSKMEEVAALFSAASLLDPGNAELVNERSDAIARIAALPLAPPEAREIAERVQAEKVTALAILGQRRNDSDGLVTLARAAAERGEDDEALALFARATRATPWLAARWLWLADARLKKGDRLGAVASLAHAASLSPGALSRLADLCRELRTTGKSFASQDVEAALRGDEDVAPVDTDTRTLVSVMTRAVAVFAGGEAASLARDTSSDARSLVERRPEVLAAVFARGLAALAAGEHEAAMRELGFSAAVADAKGEIHWLHALACTRGARVLSPSDWKAAAYADDAFDALEQALAAGPALAGPTRADHELASVIARLDR